MSTSGFITPPPNLVPPRRDGRRAPTRAPEHVSELPAFVPAGVHSGRVGGPASLPAADQAAPSWSLMFSDGTVLPITTPLLLGRDPVNRPPWEQAQLVTVHDSTKSVSKTHAVIEPVAHAVTITDLDSTNGVFLAVGDDDGGLITPGRPVRLDADAVIELGRFQIRLRRE